MDSSDRTRGPGEPASRLGVHGLHHLVYVSQASPDNGPDTLLDILRVSRWNNRVVGVTGLLVVFDNRFLQYLEGPRAAVHDTMAHIRADARHHDVRVLIDEPTDRRLFRTWDMGRLEVGSEGWRRLVEADWPTVAPLSPEGAPGIPGLEVLQDLAGYPVEELDRVRVLGYRPQDTLDEPAGGAAPARPVPGPARPGRPLLASMVVNVVLTVTLAGLLLYLALRG